MYICEYNCIENVLEENRLQWLLLRRKAELEEEKGVKGGLMFPCI